MEDLQKAMDENFTTLSVVVNNQKLVINSLESRMENNENQITNYGLKITSIEDKMAEIDSQIEELKKLNNQELNVAQIEQNKTDIDYLKLLLGVDRTENGSLNLLGNLEAEGVVAGAFTVKVTDEEKKTIGEAKIKAGEKSVTIETRAVNKNSKIFI